MKTFFIALWNITKVMFLPMFIVVAFLIIMYSTNMGHIIAHEDIHSQIYDAYDIEANISVDYVEMTGHTTVSGKDYQDKCAGTGCQILQEQNEIVGYNTGVIIMSIFSMGMLVLVIGLMIFLQFKESNIINMEILKYLREEDG